MRTTALLVLSLLLAVTSDLTAAEQRPNILVIVADDLGYADVGFNGCKDIPTPHLDALALQSTRCTNGYVTHPFCSPTRAGLLTGRYQQRFGHENNPAWLPDNTVAGLPISETTLPQVLKHSGYRTGAVGKWHLGAHPQFHPNQRGFDEYFGALGGGHVYLNGAKLGEEYSTPLDRNGKKEPLEGHLTEVLGKEASAFVTLHKSESQPWFLYLAFNAPHTPLQVTEEQLERVRHIPDETRRKYAGLVIGLDDAVGNVLNAIRDSGQSENTLVWFMSDNGGPVAVTHSRNTPLRGAKGNVFEGGIRVPFLVSWPGHVPAGRDFDAPVVSLDAFATAVAVSTATVPDPARVEGRNLVPYLSGEKASAPHDHLFWRTGGGVKFAVREGDWKLVAENPQKPLLFNLANDVGESTDLSAKHPEILARLKLAYDNWNKLNVPPLFESPKLNPAKK
jgi:arylsulfatase A-like enzyme